MPKVPTYTPNQVRNSPLPSVRFAANATPESFGAQKARNLQKVSDIAGGVATAALKYSKARESVEDKAFARDGLNSADAVARETMSEYYRQNGKDAIDSFPDTRKSLDDIRRNTAKSLKNDYQRELFYASFDRNLSGYLDKAVLHREQQRDVFEKETISAQNQSFVDAAIANRNDPAAIAESENGILANTRYLSRGLGADVIKNNTALATHDLYSSVLDAIMKDSPEAAEGYLKENWDKFDPSSRETLKEGIAEKALDERIRRKAIEFSNSGLSYEDQLKEADKIKDKRESDELVKRIEVRQKQKVTAANIQKQEFIQRQFTDLRRDPQKYVIPYNQLERSDWQALEAERDNIINGFDPVPDYELADKLYSMSPEELKQVPMSKMVEYKHKLGKEAGDDIFEYYKNVLLGKESQKSESYVSARTATQRVKDTLDVLGIDPNKGQGAAKTAELFRRAFDQELQDFQALNKRKATGAEQTAIIDNLVIQGKIKGRFGKKYFFEADGVESFDVAEVPKKHETAIRKVLEDNGVEVTPARIKKYYTDLQGGAK